MSRNRDGVLIGTARRSVIASFWLLGCAAAFQSWGSIVTNKIRAEREFEAGGDETALKATTNTDQGMPYMPRSLQDGLTTSAIDDRLEAAERYMVPEGVRYLLAEVDVQANRFEVAVIGHGLEVGERWIIDRFAIRQTQDGETVQPATRVEHWTEIERRVVNATYQLGDGRELRVLRTVVDSGGYVRRKKKADSTRRAYDWWRSLKARGLAHRVRLIKGASGKTAPFVKETLPDSTKRRDRNAGSRGDVPVLIINTDRVKDALAADLGREVPGPGYIHLPDWLSKHHRDEILAEQRTEKGWEPIGNRRNETWDLLVYDFAIWLWIGGDKVRAGKEPAWAQDWDMNTEVITADQRRELQARPRKKRRRVISKGVKA
jgi:phage terminase large subunit GpA-like protein